MFLHSSDQDWTHKYALLASEKPSMIQCRSARPIHAYIVIEVLLLVKLGLFRTTKKGSELPKHLKNGNLQQLLN